MGMVVNQRGVRGTRAHPVTYAGKPKWSSTREPEGVFYDAFKASPIGIARIALENPEGRPLFASPAHCSMPGFREEELCREHCVEFSPPEVQKQIGRPSRNCKRGC